MKLKLLAILGVAFVPILGGVVSQTVAQGSKTVLFIGSSEGGDALLVERLRGLGSNVVVQDAAKTRPEDASQKADVYVDGIRRISGAPFRGAVTYLNRLVPHTSKSKTTNHLVDVIKVSVLAN